MAFGRIVMCAFVGLLLIALQLLSIALAASLVIAACAAGATAALSHNARIKAY